MNFTNDVELASLHLQAARELGPVLEKHDGPGLELFFWQLTFIAALRWNRKSPLHQRYALKREPSKRRKRAEAGELFWSPRF